MDLIGAFNVMNGFDWCIQCNYYGLYFKLIKLVYNVQKKRKKIKSQQIIDD